MIRPDYEAIQAAARAFAESNESHCGSYKWPGTKHIEAAVDAYMAINKPAPPTDPERDKMWCQALISALPVDQVAAVLAAFKKIRETK